jgi:hypothetical protein
MKPNYKQLFDEQQVEQLLLLQKGAENLILFHNSLKKTVDEFLSNIVNGPLDRSTNNNSNRQIDLGSCKDSCRENTDLGAS